MPTPVKKVRIFVASPGDVQDERNQLAKVVDELNLIITALAPEKAIILELIRWETHVYPDMGRDAQEVVNKQIGDYDIFVGIIWKRLGTPTAVARSGTDEEFQRAYALWEKNKSLPMLIYFCQQSLPPPRTKEEVEQLGKVVDFRDELSKKGLMGDYADHASFADVIRSHLLLVLRRMFSELSETKEYSAQRTSQVDSSVVYLQVLTLAQEYEQIRNTMNSGDERTRKMEIVASKMRSLALQAYPLLQDLASSTSPGQRLAAVILLQSIPNPDYLTWLAERLKAEKPFIGYHAAVALLTAVRTLKEIHFKDLQSAIELARKDLLEKFGTNAGYKDRLAVLNEAQKELQSLIDK